MEAQPHEPRLLYLDPRQLIPDDANVRREPGDLDGLAASLRQYGVLQPLGVAAVPGGSARAAAHPAAHQYRVIYGNRRREAAILAGLATVPCLPVPFAESADHLVIQLLENMQRRDLNDMEKAEGLARLRRHVAAQMGGGATAEAPDARVAELVGMSARTVRRYLALRDLPPSVRDLLSEERLTVTQAQHLSQVRTAQQQAEIAARAVDEGWTAAQVSRVCAALARAPALTLDQAIQEAAGGWEAVANLGARPRTEGATGAARPNETAQPAGLPRRPAAAAGAESGDGDADLWLEDATGAPTPEALGESDPFADTSGRTRAGPGTEPETADGHRVFRIRTLSAFCDEVDRLARCIQDGDLQRAAQADASAPTRLRLAAKQLAFTLKAVEGLSGDR